MRREEAGEKYIKLSGLILLVLISMFILIFGLIYGLRFFAGLFDKVSISVYAFTLFVVLVPAIIFVTIEVFAFRRMRRAPKKTANVIAKIILLLLMIGWAYPLWIDINLFFSRYQTTISYYMSYNVPWLAANLFGIYLTAILQALALPKRKEWWEGEA